MLGKRGRPGPATIRAAWWLVAGICVVLVLAGAGWLIWKLPPVLYSYVPAPKDRADAEASTRTGIIAGLAGLAALGSLAVTARTYLLALQSQLTDRYATAIGQLGDDKLDIRLGGIYALERLAVDSPRDHPTIVEVLGAYVRERTRSRSHPRVRPQGRRTAHPAWLAPRLEPLAVDVQAALTVLGRLPRRHGVSRADLSDANLAGADLHRADLTGADLDRADLTGAYLVEANLVDACLAEANLTKADLSTANLARADLGLANLTKADLFGPNLSTALCLKANLTDARFAGAGKKTNLAGTHLDLTVGLTQSQLDSAEGDPATRVPPGLRRPDAWRSALSGSGDSDWVIRIRRRGEVTG